MPAYPPQDCSGLVALSYELSVHTGTSNSTSGKIIQQYLTMAKSKKDNLKKEVTEYK